MDALFRTVNLYNDLRKNLSGITSILNELELIYKSNGISNIQENAINNITSGVAEIQSVLSVVKSYLSPFETFSLCVQASQINNFFDSFKDAVQIVNTQSNDYVHKRFSELLNETVDTASFDEESQTKFKDILAKAKTLTISQIVSFILSIITILEFVHSCSPNHQLEESNELQRQQIQKSQRTNELLAEQNELIDKSNVIDRERIEQLNKIAELHNQYVDLLLEINEISVQRVDNTD